MDRQLKEYSDISISNIREAMMKELKHLNEIMKKFIKKEQVVKKIHLYCHEDDKYNNFPRKYKIWCEECPYADYSGVYFKCTHPDKR